MAKKITATISLALIGVLIIATIIMANVKINYNVNCATPNTIYVNNVEANAQQKEKIVSCINNASKTSSLSALFNGTINNKAELKAENTKRTIPSTADFLVEYVYNAEQNLMDGKSKYKDAKGNTYTYERLVFAINEAEGEAEFKVYVVEDREEPNTYLHYYVVEADFTTLYNYLNSSF